MVAEHYCKVVNRQRLLQDGLVFAVEHCPEKIALIFEDCHYTYADLSQNALKLAHLMRKRGILRGDRVAIYMENTWPCMVSIYASLFCGCVFVLINPQTKSNKLRYILEDSGARILIADISHQSVFSEIIVNTSVSSIVLSGHFADNEVNLPLPVDRFSSIGVSNEPVPIAGDVIPNDLAAIIYTSGSTGFPKGVMQTHQSMVFAAWSLIEYLRLSNQDRIMLVLPVSFDYGLYQLLMTVLLGATLIVERSFTYPELVYKRIAEKNVSVFPGVPTIFAMMLSSLKKRALCFPSVTRVTNTAAALPVKYLTGLKELFPNALIYSMYGLTECKRVSYLEPELLSSKPGSVGKAIPGTEVFLLSPEGNRVPGGETGILHVRGPHVMAGYWKKPELSKKMLIPGKVPGEKILCTQDLFRMDKDGFLYFEGRSDDMIKSHGEKISPIEIENILHDLPQIRQAAVVGIEDEILGESIIAFVVLEKGTDINSKLIKRHCVLNLENFMVPRDIVILDELPITPNRKIDKKYLKKAAIDNLKNLHKESRMEM